MYWISSVLFHRVSERSVHQEEGIESLNFIDFIKEEGFRKAMAVFVLALLLYVLRNVTNIILLTFLFSFIFYKMQRFVFKLVVKVIRINRSVVIFLIYALLILFASLFCYHYIPILLKQLMLITHRLSVFSLANYKGKINPTLFSLLSQVNLESYIKEAGSGIFRALTDVGKMGVDIFLSLVLSFFLITEKEEIASIGEKIEQSKASFLYKYYKQFFCTFLVSFNSVVESQILIAFINAVLSAIILKILGFHQVVGLGFMVFCLGLIPVAGVFISLAPLLFIAFKIGGLVKVAYVIAMIVFLHALESYILNPKFMAMHTKLPVFFTFAVLIVAEHLMGIWGLIFGIPIFLFILNLLDIKL